MELGESSSDESAGEEGRDEWESCFMVSWEEQDYNATTKHAQDHKH